MPKLIPYASKHDARRYRKPESNPCPKCKTPSYAEHNRESPVTGFHTRRRICSNPACGFRWTTAEVPLEFARDYVRLKALEFKLKEPQ